VVRRSSGLAVAADMFMNDAGRFGSATRKSYGGIRQSYVRIPPFIFVDGRRELPEGGSVVR
jgi:hypothetical protein